MVTGELRKQIEAKMLEYFDKANIKITEEEKARLEVSDFGIGEVLTTGIEILTYVNTQRVCAKEIILLPGQTCPEHLHPTKGTKLGKEETFRCRYGKVYLYVPGTPTANIQAKIPEGGTYTVFHEIVLTPGMQYTLSPDTWHWFQAGPEGCIVSEFSTRSTDEEDIFSDKRLVRKG